MPAGTEKKQENLPSSKKTSNVGDGSLCTSWRGLLGLLRKPANPVPPDCLLRFIKQADLVETERGKYTKRSGKPLLWYKICTNQLPKFLLPFCKPCLRRELKLRTNSPITEVSFAFYKLCLCRKLKRCTDFPIIEVSFAFLQVLFVQKIKTPHKLPDN